MTKLKKTEWDFGEGKKTYCYRDSDRKRHEDKHFLGTDDAIELAINEQLRRDRKNKNKGKC